MKQKHQKSSIKSNTDIKKVYVCGVQWQHEVGECNDIIMYADIEVLKAKKTCWESCGIVELDVSLSKWVHPQDLFKDLKDANGNPVKVVKKT